MYLVYSRLGRGSIPACAGEPDGPDSNTSRPTVYPRVCGGTGGAPPLLSSPLSLAWVYPRVCGGTANPTLNRTAAMGLSPRVRGNPLVLSRVLGVGGSIPACAGEP